MHTVNNFVVLDSIYGKLIINRHCDYQAETIIKTGKTHIESELEQIFSIVDKLPEDCLIIDGGANAGLFSIPVAQRIKNKNGTIIAFEPQVEIFNALAGSVVLNDLSNVKLNRVGLGSSHSTAILPDIDYSKPQDFGTVSLTSSLYKSTLNDSLVNQKTVEVVAVDDLGLSRLDFFKLDVEGYELEALRGAKNTILSYRPFLWIEYWKLGAETIINELNYLYNYRYEIKDPLNILFAPIEKINV